ncbi:hypothetical protein P7H46_03905 [Enterococcus pseudoavium]|uniref:Uncharacterized protein n=1 Tax=Enterococcus pseudoavium TaxID=44007 RepID=A0ABU3FG16_9ENTE|nr:hypothetical protein [Enterococcus pseudoavium]MDT2754234.1 hypothetical protein [Enterococcus pseudoavium]MDT2769984.1 hypothetical protein [Enterococcus pseudoavium]
MKNKECMNCGSTKFHQVENGWKCDYCGTLYLTPKKDTVPKPSIPPPDPKKKSTRLVLGIVFASFFFSIVLLTYFNSVDKTSYKPIKPVPNSSLKKSFPSNWTQNIYDSVKVATEYYDADNEKYTFEGGSNYEELEKLVGTPDTVTSWEKSDYGMPPRSMATWNKTKNRDYAGTRITVTYENKTKMITDKNYH